MAGVAPPAQAQCDNAGFRTLLGEIKAEINNDPPNLKMIEYLQNIQYPTNEDLDFMSLIIGRIINEKQINTTNFSTNDVLKKCVLNPDINNCDILLLKLIKQSIDAIGAIAANSDEGRLKIFLEECFQNYPKLSYHLKMRIQYILYRNIYKIPDSPLYTEVYRKEFVNFFDKRCLNAQYRNILYINENYILKNIDNVNQNNYNDFIDKLKKSIFNVSNDPNLLKFHDSRGDIDINLTVVTDEITFNAAGNVDKIRLKDLFTEKMRIMGGNKGVHTYHLCSSSVNISLKKVQAKSAREAAKMVAKKVLKGTKSVKFSLKRMIGKKEKYYNYIVSIDKSGKISIKSN